VVVIVMLVAIQVRHVVNHAMKVVALKVVAEMQIHAALVTTTLATVHHVVRVALFN
jgi:hypothetical protein